MNKITGGYHGREMSVDDVKGMVGSGWGSLIERLISILQVRYHRL